MKSTTQFPDNTSLTIKLKSDIDPTKIAFDYLEKVSESTDKAPIIERLKEERRKAESIEQYQEISKQIERWNALPSYADVTDELILLVGESWDLVDAETNQLKPFNQQSVKGIHFTRKIKIAERLIKDLGFDPAEITDPNGSSATSSSPSIRAAVFVNSQSGRES